MKLKHLGAFATGKQGERKNTEIAQRIAIPIANGLTQLSHHPFGTSSGRRSPQRKPKLALGE
jgi:hypothetical protein